ncbi:cell wall anchor [Pycnococcus provasolii]
MDILVSATSKDRAVACQGWCQVLCVLQMLCGATFFYTATRHLYAYTATSGELIGIVLVALAAVGILGARQRSRALLSLYLVGVLAAMLLTFGFIGQVSREVEVDCALAQLELRVESITKSQQGQSHHALFGSLFTRLDEMEGLLDMVQHGTAHVVHHRAEQKNLAVTDRQYIQAKVEMLKALARELVDDPSAATKLGQGSADGQASAEERKQLENRLDAASEVLRRIGEHENERDRELTPQEYEILLSALTSAHVPSDVLAKHEGITSTEAHSLHTSGVLADKHALLLSSIHELPNMNAALQRQKDNAYHQLEVGGAGVRLQEMRAQREERRKAWSDEFRGALEEANKQNLDVEGHLEDMPQMCLETLEGREEMKLVGYALCVLQGIAIFCVLNVLFDLPSKHE